MLSTNRSFQAQNSTCSTLLQTMLLYETCIVPSRKCLWDVSKDFWHEWCSLVITTLSARVIYRQIPVSYLQTWYNVSMLVEECAIESKIGLIDLIVVFVSFLMCFTDSVSLNLICSSLSLIYLVWNVRVEYFNLLYFSRLYSTLFTLRINIR